MQEGGDAVAAYAGLDVEVARDGAEFRDTAGGGFLFLVGELWVGVEVLVEVFVFVELWAMFGGDLGDVRHVGGCYFLPDMGGMEDVVVCNGLYWQVVRICVLCLFGQLSMLPCKSKKITLPTKQR